jgi:predicted RND superfamily exporter protein
LFTLIGIAGMLLVVYRSIVTTLIQLFPTFLGLLTARGWNGAGQPWRLGSRRSPGTS